MKRRMKFRARRGMKRKIKRRIKVTKDYIIYPSTTILIAFATTLYVFRQDPMKHRPALKPTRMRQSG